MAAVDVAPSVANEKDQAEEEQVASSSATPFPVVGIGASAGGLAAFEAFFSALPVESESGMAFVLVQHLAPDHKSILAELVRRYARMPVLEIEDGMPVRPNTVYIIPPNHDLALHNGVLQLLEPAAPHGQRRTIDVFFRSLAMMQRERAICIVLSGTGSDGTLGARAIKGEGGMLMAQNPESTDYDGMPRSAIATGLVDYVLPPAEMPAQLLAYATRSAHPRAPLPATNEARADLQQVFAALQEQTGHDFSLYKQNTIGRRLERRMAIHQIEKLGDYVRRLKETPAEADALFRELLIGVTSFFRDPEAFEVLGTQLLPRLLARKSVDSVIRVWVAGCSTGEEAYSIAILLREKLDALDSQLRVQVFATDIDARAIAIARAGLYSANVAADISKERLARCFSQQDDGSYRIQKNIRDLLVFSEQDVVKDPPFSNLDLISCRNLMIYMGPELQQKLIPLFHYALCPGGALLLGSSETIGEFGNLFSSTDRKTKLYQRKDDHGAMRPFLGKLPPPGEATDTRRSKKKGPQESGLSPREITERALSEDTPVAALVNERGDLLYLHGHTGQYLEPAPGAIAVNILKMAREGLRHDLTAALHRAVTKRERVQRPQLRVKTNGDFTLVDLTVRPVLADAAAPGEPGLFLVTFEPAQPSLPVLVETTTVGNGAGIEPHQASAERERIIELERELRTKDEYLHATHEEMQSSNEELQSTNEELQSTNEELQSTNEELETSKEELQSLNEELATVNAELQSKVTDLSGVNNDMNNLLSATGIGTVFVDKNLRIRRFTPAATQFINLIQTDVGRPLAHIVSNLVGYDRLLPDLKAVLETLTPGSVEVQTLAGASYLLRIKPYRTTENVVEGAVITFTEVTAIKDLRAALQESETLRGQVGAVRDAQDAITVQDMEGRILAWNPGAVRMYGWSEIEALAMNIRGIIPASERDDALTVVQRLSRAEILEPFRTQRVTRNGELVNVTLTATALLNGAGAVYAVSTTERGMAN
jgi:two-component system, chemotaxis family, CheB/CheR fusion protein